MTEKIEHIMKTGGGFITLSLQERIDLKNEILSLSDEDATDVIFKIINKGYRFTNIKDENNELLENYLVDSDFEKYYDIIWDNPEKYGMLSEQLL